MADPIKDVVYKNHPEGNITQWFGENPELYRRFGIAYHNGIDIVAPWGTPIYCVEEGTVVKVKLDPGGFGKHIRVLCSSGRIWTYAHLANIHVVETEEVKAGEQLGRMGNTGFVISGDTPFWAVNPYGGTHLHLGVRRYEFDEDGWRYNQDMKRIKILDYDNGVKGAVDPMQFLGNDNDKIIQKQLTVISLLNQVIDLLKKLRDKKR